MSIHVETEAFNPWERLQRHEQTLDRRCCGAVASFVGTMRDFNAQQHIDNMFLEHYPGMTEHYLEHISSTAKQRWDIHDILIIHRIGDLAPGDYIVLTAVWAVHRAPALTACRYLIEELKSHAPFWKREKLSDGQSRWVTHNTPAQA